MVRVRVYATPGVKMKKRRQPQRLTFVTVVKNADVSYTAFRGVRMIPYRWRK
jgi:hypothetical protein